MASWLKQERWSPYAVGSGIGVLSWITFYFMDKALGASTTMVKIAGGLEALVARAHVEANTYFAQHLVTTAKATNPFVDWQMALVAMLLVGAFVAARLAGSTFRENVPALWAWRFGPSPWRRHAWAFIGGMILLFGARLADGCTSGHSLSGGLQLALSSWTFTVFMFASGVATAFVVYGKEGRSHV